MSNKPITSTNSWIGTLGADTYVGAFGDDIIQGSGGNDTLSGGRGKDRFVFESTFSANGTDTIKDFFVKSASTPSGADFDILDLSKAVGRKISISNDNIGNYVWVLGDKLYVDPSGNKSSSNPWAILNGVKEGDQLRIRTGSFDGWITAGANQAKSVYLTVGLDGVWQEDAASANGIRDGSEALISGASLQDTNSDGFYTINGIDFSGDNVTVRFVSWSTTTKLDLSGFGTGDKIILDSTTNLNNYLGADLDGTFRAVTSQYATINTGANKAAAGIYRSQYTSGRTGTYYYASAGIAKRSYTTKVQGYFSLYNSAYRNNFQTRIILSDGAVSDLAKGLTSGAAAAFSYEIITPIG